MATRDANSADTDSTPPGAEEKSARRELAEGLGSLLRAAKKAVAEVDPARLEALGLRAMRELEASRLGELGRKAVERVERFDPTKFAGAADLFSVVEKVADQVESFVRPERHASNSEPAPRRTPAAAEPGTPSQTSGTSHPTPPAAAPPPSTAPGPATAPASSAPSAENATSSDVKSDEAAGAKWRLRVDD